MAMVANIIKEGAVAAAVDMVLAIVMNDNCSGYSSHDLLVSLQHIRPQFKYYRDLYVNP